MDTRIVSKVILLGEDNTILLLRRGATDQRRPNEWDVPGGQVEPGEFPTEAAARETVEEAGIITDARDLRLVYAMTETVSESLSVTWLFYLGRTTQSNVTLSNEHSGYAWVDPDEVLEYITYDRQKRALQYVLDNKLTEY